MSDAIAIITSMNTIEQLGLGNAGALLVLAYSIFKWGSMLYVFGKGLSRVSIRKK